MPSTCCINQDLVACSVLWTARFPRSISLRPSFAFGKKHSQTRPSKRHSTLFYIIQSRAAARKELLNQADSPDECEKLYEQSLWCLYALQDELLQVDNPFMDEDRNTITTCKSQYVIQPPCLDVHMLLVCRDQTYKATTDPVPRPNGNERT